MSVLRTAADARGCRKEGEDHAHRSKHDACDRESTTRDRSLIRPADSDDAEDHCCGTSDEGEIPERCEDDREDPQHKGSDAGGARR